MRFSLLLAFLLSRIISILSEYTPDGTSREGRRFQAFITDADSNDLKRCGGCCPGDTYDKDGMRQIIKDMDHAKEPSDGARNPYSEFEPPTKSRDEANIKHIRDNIETERYPAAHLATSNVLKRFSCSYVLQQLYGKDRKWFSKLIQFCKVASDDIQSLCMFRGLVRAVLHNGDANDTIKAKETTAGIMDKVSSLYKIGKPPFNVKDGMKKYKKTEVFGVLKNNYDVSEMEWYQALGAVRQLENHAVGNSKKAVQDILKPYSVYFDAKETVKSIIDRIEKEEGKTGLFESFEHSLTAVTPEFNEIFTQLINHDKKHLASIIRFIGKIKVDYELILRLTETLVNGFLIPSKTQTPGVLFTVLRTIDRANANFADVPQDLRLESKHLAKQLLQHVNPTPELEEYLRETGLNLNASQIARQVVADIQSEQYASAENKLFIQLDDIQYFSAIQNIVEEANIEIPENFERFLEFTSRLKTKDRSFCVVRAWVLHWMYGSSVDLLQVLRLEQTVVKPNELSSVLQAFQREVSLSVRVELSVHFLQTRGHACYKALEYAAQWFPSIFKTYFSLFLSQNQIKTENVLYGIERYHGPDGGQIMYTSVVEHGLKDFDIMRLTFGFKSYLDKVNKTLLEDDRAKYRALPTAAWNVLASPTVCLVYKKHGTVLGVSRSAPSNGKGREVGLYPMEAHNIAKKWIIERPDLTLNIYFILNAELDEYLINPMLDFGNDKGKLFTRTPKERTKNAVWHIDLEGMDVAIMSDRWGEYLYGGRLLGKDIVYTRTNPAPIDADKTMRTRGGQSEKVGDIWGIEAC